MTCSTSLETPEAVYFSKKEVFLGWVK